MSHDRDDPAPFFDVRNVDLTKLNKIIDLEIVIGECDDKVTSIEDQIARNYGDEAWKRDAERAKAQIERKCELAVMKLEALKLARDAHAASLPEDSFRKRFMQVAATILDQATYSQVFEAARFTGEVTPP